MANNIFWGKIYEYTNWGIGVVTNTISWGKIYADLVGALPSFALNFANISTDFTFTRASDATRVNEQGLIETVTKLGSEEVANGTFDLGSELITSGNETEDIVSIADNQNITIQTLFITIGKTYQIDFEIYDYAEGSIYLLRPTDLGVGTAISANGTYSYTVEADASTSLLFRTDGVSTTLKLRGISVKQVNPNDSWTEVNSTISDGKGNMDSTSSTSILYQQNILIVGKTYKANLDVSNYNGLGTCALIDSNGGTQFEITSDGNKDFYFTHSGSSANLSFRAASGGIFSIDNVSIKEVLEDDVPRIDYTNGVGEFLLEPASTNLLAYSEDFTQTFWNVGNGAVKGTNYIISPDGTQNAFNLIANSGVMFRRFGLGLTNGAEYTFSCYYKGIVGETVRLGFYDGVGIDYKIETFTGDWDRFNLTFTAGSSNNNIYIADNRANATSTSFHVYGAQVEALSYATSYIPTNGTTVTRAAELCVDATPTINSEEGVLYAEISALGDSGTHRVFSLNSGSFNNRVQIGYTSVSNQLNAIVQSNGVISFNTTEILLDTTQINKIAIRYSLNDFSLWVNGVEVATDTNGNTPIGLNSLDFNVSNAGIFYGRSKDLRVYTEALTDEQLTELTTI